MCVTFQDQPFSLLRPLSFENGLRLTKWRGYRELETVRVHQSFRFIGV